MLEAYYSEQRYKLETHGRTIIKSISWRIGGLLMTFFITLVITRKIELAASIGLADTAVKIVAYYIHERLWLKVRFGRLKEPTYEI